jgi:Phasin protein.
MNIQNIQIEKLIAPAQELALLNVASFEKLVDLQIEGLTESAKAGVESLKQAVAVKDIEGVKSYVAGQVEATKAVVENISELAKKVAGIAQSYQAGVKKIVEGSLAIS